MSILAFAIVVFLVVVLLIWAVDALPAQPPLNIIGKVSIIIVAVIVICDRAGFL